MIHLVFAESSLELVPNNLLGHPAVRNYRKRYSKGKEILLDDSYFHSAMKNLKGLGKRGRPDIVHFCLLEAMGSPLCLQGKLKFYVHTLQNHLLKIDSQTRLPRNYMRFKGLMEEVFRDKKSKNNLIVMEENVDFKEFIKDLNCKNTMGFSVEGKRKRLQDIFSKDFLKEDIALIIGAFPKGHFSNYVKDMITDLVSIYPDSLDAWVVTSRVLGQIEIELGMI